MEFILINVKFFFPPFWNLHAVAGLCLPLQGWKWLAEPKHCTQTYIQGSLLYAGTQKTAYPLPQSKNNCTEKPVLLETL